MITRICRIVLVCITTYTCVIDSVMDSDHTIVWKLKTPVYLRGKASILCMIHEDDKPGHMAWTKAGQLIGINNASLYSTKYDVFIKYNSSTMMYHLVIKNIDMGDLNLVYKCESGFSSAEGILSLNEDTFVAKPQEEDITKNFTSKAGYLKAYVEVARVYPKPICIAEFKDRDITTYSKTNYTKESFFYSMEFDLVYQTNECGNINISCVIGKEKLSILQLSHEFKEGCKHSNTRSASEIEVIVIIVGVLIAVALFAAAFLIFRYLRRSENGTIENTVSAENMPLLTSVTSQRKLLSTDERTAYIEALQSGKEVRKYVRIQVIGKNRVGKTSLVRRLLRKPIDDVTSTDGIDIDRTCQIRTSDGEWIISEVKTEKENIRRRVMHAINSYSEGKARHQSEDYVSETEEKQGNHKRDPSQDYFLPTEKNEHKTFPADEHKPIQPNQQILIAETLGANVSAKKNDNEPLTKYTDECSSGLNNSLDYNKSIIRDTGDSELIEPIQTAENQNHLNSDKADEITEAVNENMDDILLYAKYNKEKNTSDMSDGLVDCGIWDFAGEKDYYATHQTFLTPYAIYLLVADITDDIKPMEYDEKFDICSCGEYTDFWLDSIHCFHEAFEDSADNALHPPVVMVCTGMDKVPDKDKQDRKTEYEQKFLDTFECQDKSSHRRGKIHFISNTESPPKDFEILRKDISKIAHEMQYFAETLPTRWVQLEIALATLKAIKGKDNIGYCERFENIKKLAKKSLIENDELLRFLNYQHKIGNVIFFDDQRDYVILKPKWLVDSFRCIVCNEEKKHCTYTEVYDLKNKGILSDHLLEKMFSKEPALMFGKYKNHILDVMEKFNIIVKPKSTNSYYMPCMIENSSSLEDIKKAFDVTNSNCTPWLVLEFRFLPIGYFNHIMFKFIKEYTVCNYKEKSTIGDGRPAIFAGKAVVYLDETKLSRLIICLSRNAISLQIWKYNDVHDDTYRHIIEQLCSTIEGFETTLNHQLQYNIKSKCSTGDYCSSSGRLSYAEMDTIDERYKFEEHKEWHTKKDMDYIWLKHVPTIINAKQATMEAKKTGEKFKQMTENNKSSKNIKDKDIQLPWVVDVDEYQRMVSHGTYLSYENRLSLGGPYKAGKSTLASVLIGEKIPLEWDSMGELVINFGTNGIDIEKKKMVRLIEGKRGHEVLAKILRGKPHDLNTYEQVNIKRQARSPDRTAIAVQINNSTSESLATYTSLIKDTTHTTSQIAIKSHDAMTESAEKCKGRHILNKAHGQTTEIGQFKSQELQLQSDLLNEVRKGRYKHEIAPSDLVDIGGPKLYDMTHQLFIQQRGSFLLMFDGRFGLHDQLKEYPQGVTASSILKQLVESILTYTEDTDDIMPMILFAATHRDACKNDIARTKDNFKQDIEQMFSEHEKKKHIHLDTVYFINGLDEQDTEIQCIRDQVVNFATQQSSWGQRRPIQWVPLEMQLSNVRLKNINIITKEDLRKMNMLNDDLVLNERQLNDFLLVQHSLGKLMYYNLTGLDNFIILHPPTLVNILRSFLADDIFFPNDKTLKSILQNLTETGKITKIDLLKLWQQDDCLQYMLNDNTKEFFIQLLIHLEVLIIPKADKTDSDFYLVPSMIKTLRPPDFLSLKSQAGRTINIRYALNRQSIPAALAYKVIGTTLNAWPLKYDGQQKLCLYQKAVVVNVSEHNELRVFIEDNRVMVYLTNKESLLSMSPYIAASVQECLTKNLEASILLHYNSCGKKIDPNEISEKYTMELGFPCGNDLCFISSKEIRKQHSWKCQKGIEHQTKYLLYWTFNKEQKQCGVECKGLTEKELKIEPSEKHLVRLAKFIDVNSSTTFLNQLGVDETIWKKIKYEYANHRFEEILIIALIKWKNYKLSQKPTVKHVSDALTSVNSYRHLTCQVFREDLKSIDFANINLHIIPSDELLMELSKHIGNCPLQLGIELGLSFAEVEDSLLRFQKDLPRLIKDILFKWKAKANVKTIHTLMMALEQVNSGGLQYLINKLKLTN